MAVETQAHFRADELVQLAIRLRERRHELFGPAFNADPGWDILLRAYAARLCNERFSLVELTDRYPGSALARWARWLEEEALIECRSDYLIPTSLWLALTEKGELKMSKVFEAAIE